MAAYGIAISLKRHRIAILEHRFSISHHAGLRMLQRNIGYEEILQAVKLGCMGNNALQKPDFESGCFYYRKKPNLSRDDLPEKGLFVIVGAPRGDRAAEPTIMTVFRDGESVLPEDGYLDSRDVAALSNLRAPSPDAAPRPPPPPPASPAASTATEIRIVEKIVTREICVPIEDLSIEQLRAHLDAKIAARDALRIAPLREAWTRLTACRNVLATKIQNVDRELASIEAELDGNEARP